MLQVALGYRQLPIYTTMIRPFRVGILSLDLHKVGRIFKLLVTHSLTELYFRVTEQLGYVRAQVGNGVNCTLKKFSSVQGQFTHPPF